MGEWRHFPPTPVPATERERGEEKRGAKQADKEVAEARHVLPTRATAAMVVDQ